MRKVVSIIVSTLTLVLIFSLPADGQNPDMAKDLADEGVIDQAKIEFIKVLHDPSKKTAYPEAHYYLGALSFREQNYDRALMHWSLLSKEYPDNSYTEKAREQMRIAYSLLSKQQTAIGESAEIRDLFEDADFLVGQPLKISIDTSFLSTGDLAIQSLEQIVTKYPDSRDAPLALFREVLVYYGWRARGEGYGFAYAQAGSVYQLEYIEKMAKLLRVIQKHYPESQYQVPVAYLIGQAYWSRAGGKVDDDARNFWNIVIDLTKDDDANSYRQIVKRRLE